MGCIHLNMYTPNCAADLNIPWDIKRKKQKRRGEGNNLIKVKHKEAELCIKSSEPGGVPWVQLEAIILCIAKAIGSSSKYFIYYEGALPFRFELILFLLREA